MSKIMKTGSVSFRTAILTVKTLILSLSKPKQTPDEDRYMGLTLLYVASQNKNAW